MKSIFTKLSTLLLCGAVAMVSCTDFSEDIQNLDNKVDNLGNTTQTELATLQKAITDLEAKLAAQYATKDEVAALKATLENSIASEVAALSEDIAAVSDALKTAKGEINDAIADLDDKKADKTAVDAAVKTATDAIAALKADLEAAKGDLEAEIESVKAEIADAQEQLNSKIDGVDAKAEELHNTILALSDYLKTLEAKVNELKGTLDALSEYLPTIEAKVAELKGTLDALSDHLEGREAEVDAKLNELHATLLALSDHLEEYEATTDFKLVELQGSLAALSVYLEEYEASVDAKFKEILNTFDSLDGFLDEKFAALEATDTDLYKEIEGIRVVLTALNNLLTDETAARMAEDNDLYELIGTSVTALNNLIADLAAEDEAIYAEIDGVRQAFTTLNNLLADEVADRTAEDAAIYELIGTSVTALNNLIADLAAQDDAIYVEMENIRTYIAQVYNSLSYDIKAVDAALQAHIAAFEAYKAQMEEKVAELEATDTDLYGEINGLREVITTINNHIDDLRAEDEAIYLEINGLRENLTQLQNAINNRIDEEVAALEDKILESVQDLESMIRDTQEALTVALKDIADLFEMVQTNAAAIAKLETAVEILNSWAEAHKDEYDDLVQLVTKHVADLTEQIEALNEKDLELEANIGETSKALSALIEDTEERFGQIEVYIEENFNQQGTAIRNLENILNDLRAEFDELANRVAANEIAIKELFERVQSLVYVPDYNDHKATIEWATISAAGRLNNTFAVPTYVVKTSDLKYLVKAEKAAEVATAIAANWSKVLDYNVKAVKTRAADEADLEIVNVVAQGEYIVVSVLAKNFATEFFENEKSYSAALVLADDNNTRSTEYTNLIAGTPVEFQMNLFLETEETELDGNTIEVVENGSVITYKMACNDTELVKSAVKPLVGFVPVVDGEAVLTAPLSFYSPEYLASEGYDIDVDMAITIVNCEKDVEHDGTMDVKPDYVKIDPYFNIEAGNPVYDFHYTVKEGVSFDNVGKSSTVEYVFTCGNVSSSLTYEFKLANAQVTVDMETSAEWTIALQDSLFDGKNHYAYDYTLVDVPFEAVGGPVAHLKPVLNSPAVHENGYPKFYVKDAEGEWVQVEKRSFELAAFNDNATVDIKLLGGTYSWNNSYKIVWSTTNDEEHVDYTTTAIVNLVGRPEKIDVEIPVEFVLKGTNSWFEAPADLCGEAFKQLDQYLEYGDSAADKAKWESIFESYVTRYNAVELGMPVVNGETSKWIANLDQLATAKLFIGKNKIYEDQPNVITWSVKPWWGVPVNFTITGDVTVPATAENFIYSQDYVKDINGRPYAEVFGKIEEVEGDEEVGASKKYSIIKSDLAKYFNLDIESLEGHNYTVDFEVTLPDAESEIGNVKVLDKDGNENYVTPVVTDKGAATYYYFLQDQTVLDWDTYRGLEVIVSATLKVNGYPVDSKKLALITKDPLTLTGADFSVTRKLRENTPINVYKSLVLTSSVEEFANLLTTDKKAVNKTESNVAASLAEAEAYANQVYGADIEVVLGPKGVYYYDNSGKLIILGTNKYGYDEQTGILTIYGDDANVKNYYAEFTAVMSSVICGGEHKVPFRVTATVAK